MADSNFEQFARMGNPWVTEKTWDRELRDAGNPRCSTGRRRSAMDFVAKSHNMRFPEPVEPKPAPARSGPSATAKVLSARNRIAEIRRVPETVSKPAMRPTVVVEEDAETVAERKARREKIAYYAMFINPKRPRPHIEAPLVFRNYSEIVSLFGSVENYLKGDHK